MPHGVRTIVLRYPDQEGRPCVRGEKAVFNGQPELAQRVAADVLAQFDAGHRPPDLAPEGEAVKPLLLQGYTLEYMYAEERRPFGLRLPFRPAPPRRPTIVSITVYAERR